jgi:hypothetical protein
MTTTKPARLNNTERTTLRNFSELSDNVRAAREALDKAERALNTAEPGALEILQNKGAQVVDGRSFAIGESVKVSATASDAELTDFARANGLKVTPPKPETLASATLRAAALKGLDVSEVAEVTRTPVIVLS